MENLNNNSGIRGPDSNLSEKFTIILGLDIKKDFTEQLNATRFGQFRKDFTESMRSITDSSDFEGNERFLEYLTSYFEKTENPLDKINELRRIYLGNHIDLSRSYKIKESPGAELNINNFSVIQKAIINIVNGKDIPKLEFTKGDENYVFELERNNIETRLHIITKDRKGKFEGSYFLVINEKDRALDNIVHLTNQIKNYFFGDFHISLDENLNALYKDNLKNINNYMEAKIRHHEFLGECDRANVKLNKLINASYKEKYGSFPENLNLYFLNNLILEEKGKICISFGNTTLSSNFKYFDNVSGICSYIYEISAPGLKSITYV